MKSSFLTSVGFGQSSVLKSKGVLSIAGQDKAPQKAKPLLGLPNGQWSGAHSNGHFKIWFPLPVLQFRNLGCQRWVLRPHYVCVCVRARVCVCPKSIQRLTYLIYPYIARVEEPEFWQHMNSLIVDLKQSQG